MAFATSVGAVVQKYRHNIRHEKPGVHNVSDEDEYSYPEEAQTPRDEEQGKMASYLLGYVFTEFIIYVFTECARSLALVKY
jgi:hypothetical protein